MPEYKLVELRNGTWSIYSEDEEEIFHPGIGPTAEATSLYVQQLNLQGRVEASTEPFVIWDVGLGAGANALVSLNELSRTLKSPRRLELVSFDLTLDALRFARLHSEKLDYALGHENRIAALIGHGRTVFTLGSLTVDWRFVGGDFTRWVKASSGDANADIPPPHAIFFDPHSPARNPAMWNVDVFKDMFARLDPQRPCSLANFTRSTLARTAMLLGGFFVGVGESTGEKEETTQAANHPGLIPKLLDQRWLERAFRSDSAEPLGDPTYRRAPLTESTRQKLLAHPQFKPGAVLGRL